MTPSKRVLVSWAVAVGLCVIAAAAEAPPRSGCGARAYADSCVDACCAWCPAIAANASAISPVAYVRSSNNERNDGDSSAEDEHGHEDSIKANGSAAATAKGSCHERGHAPCGSDAIMRPASECYIELAVSVGSVFAVVAIAMAACYARRRWMRRRTARAKANRRPTKGDKARPSHQKTLSMVDIPHAQSVDGTLVYYASPYAVARDVEYAAVSVDDGSDHDGSEGAGGTGCSACWRAR
ncbi:hypothetical protein psal_cds_877 [Pandoravirus salinus]|uniref:Uncharacterized protein n=1 Tax=Pandoravirus salinus TaxID=1349410 RepID=S4VZL0_9VIRU|nr:hypothetical protein psal_cds_877 [Pandoravirus salinus]AGO84951.1 hypothetical protein psal_cds_877 [Pandoravirus salinus]